METTAKYTPGPWMFCGTHVDDSRGLPLVRSAHRDFDKINCSDFHLIAAAPELLEALEAICEFWDFAKGEDEMSTSLSPDALIGGHSGDEPLTIHEVVAAAIAKSRGE